MLFRSSALNSLAGDIGFKHKIVVLPPGSQTHPQKPTALADEFDQLVMEWVMMAFEVQPMELGIIMGRGGKSGGGSSTASGTGTGAASIQKSTADRKALKPLLMWLKRSIFDFILRDVCGQDDMEWKWRGVDDNPMDPEAHANQLQTLSSFGALSIDEVRDELGRSPWGLPMTSDPVFIGQAGPIPFGQIAPLEEQEAEGLDDPIEIGRAHV